MDSVEKGSALDMLPAQAVGTVMTETRINKWLNLLEAQGWWVAMTMSSGDCDRQTDPARESVAHR